MKKQGIKRINITPCSPLLNAAVKIKGFIKNILRKVLLNGKLLKSNNLKGDSLSNYPWYLEGWINFYLIEIMNKMKYFK